MADFDTLRIRAGYDPADHNYSVNVPIYQTAAFDLGSTDRAEALWAMERDDAIYTRVGNPTVAVLEERVRQLDGAHAALALSSGMAAISYTILALTEGGGNIVAAASLYGGSEDSFSHFFPRFGAHIKFSKNRFDPASYEAEIDENTRGIYIESISNPNAELYDIEALAEIAHRHGIPLIVDNTVATPYLLNPLKHGADIVIYSATKALGGHGNVIGGIILEGGSFTYKPEKFPQFYEKSYKLKDRNGNRRSPHEVDPKGPLNIHLRAFYLEFIGAALGPFDAYLILQGLDTISERVQKQTATAEKLVKYLESRDDVAWVKHPASKNSPFKELAGKYFPKGAGPLFSFGFTGSDAQLDKFLRHLRYFSYHVNIGDVRSLIVNSPKTTHAELDSEHLKRAGIDVNTVRISAGLESADDLIRDLDEAFDFVFGNNETEITSAGIEDLEEIAALEKLCFPPGKAASEEAFLYRLKSYPEWFLTARINGTIVGLINGAPSDRQFITDDVYKPGGAYNKSGESLLIYGLIVHPDYRRRGIASRLIKTMLEKAAHHNKKHIALTAREALIPYYEGFGFRNHGISESVTGGVAGYDLALDIK